jgi:glycosyltransferase involved in cell wall biosynthesis
MRLLVIANAFPNPIQPTKGIFNGSLVRELARAHDITVVSPILWTDEWRAGRAARERLGPGRAAVLDGVDVHYPRYYYSPKVLRGLYGWYMWCSVRGTVRRLVRERRPDVVLGHWAHPDGAVAVRAGRLAGAPVAVLLGGSDILLLGRNRWRRRCITRVLRDADAVVTVSRDLRQKVADLGIPLAKVHLVYRGVDVDLFCPGDRATARKRLRVPPAARVLLWVGRMVPVKGLEVLLEACTRLQTRGEAFHLYLVGDGPLRKGLEQEARRLGLAGSVSFLGARPQEELPGWYRAADLTVLPSHSEGVPNVLRESLACGTPFVATDVGGVAEIPAGPPSRLVPPGDAEALAGALARALADGRGAAGPAPESGTAAESAAALGRILEGLVAGDRPASPRARCHAGAG